MKNSVFGLLLCLLLPACKKDDKTLPLGIDTSLLGTGASGEWRYQPPADVTPAPTPISFTASTGLGFGAVEFVLGYPEYTGDYARIDFRYNPGRTAPADCDSGSLALSAADFTRTSFNAYGLFANEDYAFIACIYDHTGNLTQASSTTIAKAGDARRIFMSSATFNGNLAASYNEVSFTDGVEGANYRCQALATQAGLDGTWEAILSAFPERTASDKMSYAGPIYNIKGQQIARSSTQFWSNIHSTAMNYDENGQVIAPSYDGSMFAETGFVWAGTTSYGYGIAGFECNNWSSASSSSQGYIGDPSNVTDSQSWIAQTSKTCDKSGHLLCVEAPTVKPGSVTVTAAQGAGNQVQVSISFPDAIDYFSRVELIRSFGSSFSNYTCENYIYGSSIKTYNGTVSFKFEDNAVTDTVDDGIYHYVACVYDRNSQLVQIARSSPVTVGADFKRVFVSSATYNGNLGGISGANSKCSTLASAAGLGGGYKAIITDTAAGLDQNVAITKNTYDLDGRYFSNTDYIFLSYGYNPAAYAVGTDENGDAVPVGTRSWTGSNSSGSPATHCSGWTSASSSASANYGIVNFYQNYSWKNHGVSACDQLNHIYCIEQ